ncbi:MAG: glycoside hydrolase family 5 protein [Elusimicrobia bacterium]|nr:glycoside hydrolase family 5 protein [Elusimicrobiota bacterium]
MLASLVLAASVSLAAAEPPAFVTAKGPRLLAPDGKPLLTRGTSFGNWLVPEGYMFLFEKAGAHRQIAELFKELVGPEDARAFWDMWFDTYVTKKDVERLKALGMNLLRVPFNAKLLNPEDYPDVWDEAHFKRLDRVIAWCKEAGLYVVLDMHVAHGGQTGSNIDDSAGGPWLFDSAASEARTAEVWRRVARRYKDEPAILGYELLNEPIAHYYDVKAYNPKLEPVYKRLVDAVRAEDPRHLILIGGAQWNTEFGPLGPPFAPGLVYTFHKYWTDPTIAVIKQYLEFRKRYDVPLWMGESGENTDEWIAKFRAVLEKEEIGWAFWPYKKMRHEEHPGTSLCAFPAPPHWDKIAAYAECKNGAAKWEDCKKPAPEESRAALAGLLKNIRFDQCPLNPGYVKALGLSLGASR